MGVVLIATSDALEQRRLAAALRARGVTPRTAATTDEALDGVDDATRLVVDRDFGGLALAAKASRRPHYVGGHFLCERALERAESVRMPALRLTPVKRPIDCSRLAERISAAVGMTRTEVTTAHVSSLAAALLALGGSLRGTLHLVDACAVVTAYERCDRNVSRTAEHLGESRKYIAG